MVLRSVGRDYRILEFLAKLFGQVASTPLKEQLTGININQMHQPKDPTNI